MAVVDDDEIALRNVTFEIHAFMQDADNIDAFGGEAVK